MKRGTVYIPTPQGGFRMGRFEPQWSAGGEVPLYTTEYAEGDFSVYGSGTAVVTLRDVPIIARMPIAAIGSRLVWGVPLGRREGWGMALKKIAAAAGSPAGGGPGVGDAKDWPTLVEYLTVTVYPDGQPRVPSALIVVADSNGWRGCLSDKDNSRSLWKTAPTLLDLLQSIEEAAASDDPSAWRQSADAKWKGKKRS